MRRKRKRSSWVFWTSNLVMTQKFVYKEMNSRVLWLMLNMTSYNNTSTVSYETGLSGVMSGLATAISSAVSQMPMLYSPWWPHLTHTHAHIHSPTHTTSHLWPWPCIETVTGICEKPLNSRFEMWWTLRTHHPPKWHTGLQICLSYDLDPACYAIYPHLITKGFKCMNIIVDIYQICLIVQIVA